MPGRHISQHHNSFSARQGFAQTACVCFGHSLKVKKASEEDVE